MVERSPCVFLCLFAFLCFFDCWRFFDLCTYCFFVMVVNAIQFVRVEKMTTGVVIWGPSYWSCDDGLRLVLGFDMEKGSGVEI